MPIRVAIFGSTGSIGTQTLEVIRWHPGKFQVAILTAQQNADLLIEQALAFRPGIVVIGAEACYAYVRDALQPWNIRVLAGKTGLEEAAATDCYDIILTAIVGFAGLTSTLIAAGLKKNIALANKESLVVAGDLLTKTASENKVNILPVDSEHSAIYQCLQGENWKDISRVIVTASGGPFRGKKVPELIGVTSRDALRHPNWRMGAKISIDSASLMNKGLELIEARWLFDLSPSQLEVVVHHQSIVHSMVEFVDGSIKAQLGIPDMKLPIQYALAYPQRTAGKIAKLDIMQSFRWDFSPPDLDTFRNLALAKQALHTGGNVPCVLNAANEVAVENFLQGRIGFLEMSDIVEKTMIKIPFKDSLSLEEYIACDEEARRVAGSLI
ncbi:1-deoxy-D-xylulose-5-phosphate reductoisomerase [Chitinophaga sp. Mgbs1]|uniref:1-deoxy-D-xylulose 5-phosphate reductoisomerase n=1 Tax=Chitinophaga solisilvae TaxID=1233460 RepID=A0A433WN40_9BACT|nr:1-deoxy-D-xylulose-5-phosphate reductoisomerase [Chitinophaga solisilvae]